MPAIGVDVHLRGDVFGFEFEVELDGRFHMRAVVVGAHQEYRWGVGRNREQRRLIRMIRAGTIERIDEYAEVRARADTLDGIRCIRLSGIEFGFFYFYRYGDHRESNK